MKKIVYNVKSNDEKIFKTTSYRLATEIGNVIISITIENADAPATEIPVVQTETIPIIISM